MTGRVLEIDPNTRLVEVDPGDRNATADEKRRKESVATQLVNLALAARIELWHDPDKNPWATLKFEGHIEHHPLKTKAVKRYLQGLFFEETESAPHSEGVQTALGVLESRAVFKGDEHAAYVRVSEVGATIYLDLCNEHWQVICITQDGWSVIPMADCPVRFRRPRGAKPLPLPRGDKTRPGLPNIGSVGVPGLGALAKLINVHMDSREWRLLVAWLLSLFRGQIPYPILVFNGEQGSGKSTAVESLLPMLKAHKADLLAALTQPANLETLLTEACQGVDGIDAPTFKSLLSPEDVEDIEGGHIPVVTLNAYARSFAEGIRVGRIAVLAAVIPKPAVTERVRCADCRHFERDTVGDGAGIGGCKIGGEGTGPIYPALWANAERQCKDFESREEGAA